MVSSSNAEMSPIGRRRLDHGEELDQVEHQVRMAEAQNRLDSALAQGAVALKWLPSSMAIDLRAPRLTPFYERLASTRLPVIVHCGEEKAVPGAGREDLGNPLLVRAALARDLDIATRIVGCPTLRDTDDGSIASARAAAAKLPPRMTCISVSRSSMFTS